MNDLWMQVPDEVTETLCASMIAEGSPSMHVFWLSMMYKRYRFGEWAGRIPEPEEMHGEGNIMWDFDQYCILHARHNFGNNIFEVADTYNPKAFAFFDYEILQPVFDALDQNRLVPHIPTYHAFPTDRWDFQNKRTVIWDETWDSVFVYK